MYKFLLSVFNILVPPRKSNNTSREKKPIITHIDKHGDNLIICNMY